MKKYFYGFLVLAVIISLYFLLRPTAVPVEVEVLQKGPFVETLAAEGKVHSRQKQTLYAFATGSIENLQVKVGDVVQKGQVLTRLEWDLVMIVKSPIDGVVSKLHRESGGPIVRGEPIIEISNLSDLEVVAELLTPDAVRLSPKGSALILNWGGAGELKAQISQISRAGSVKMSALGVEEERTEVKLSFDQIPKELQEKFGDNYHVNVLFLISQEDSVLSVPLGALFKNGSEWAVYIVNPEKRANLKVIQISKRNDQRAVVTSGLSEGDTVILFPGDQIREGSLVQLPR